MQAARATIEAVEDDAFVREPKKEDVVAAPAACGDGGFRAVDNGEVQGFAVGGVLFVFLPLHMDPIAKVGDGQIERGDGLGLGFSSGGVGKGLVDMIEADLAFAWVAGLAFGTGWVGSEAE